jgi:predicted O-methyltransferase YrrM
MEGRPIPRISRIVVDSSDAMTELCMLGKATGADKSPYNEVGHRHPYTGAYTMLFGGLKARPVRFAEIGVAGGASGLVWDAFFTHPETRLCMFDRDENFLANARRMMGDRAILAKMDVGVDGDVARALKETAGDAAGNYDVIIDDSSHEVEHQLRIVREAFPLLKSGGLLIVEDVFRIADEEQYVQGIGEEILGNCAAAYFVMCEHNLRWSPGWDNDKLLVLVKA